MASEQVRVCWLSGNFHERKLVLDKIKGQFPGAEIHNYDNDISFAYLEQQMYMSSCFSEKKIFILRALPQFSTTKVTMISHLKKLIENIPSDCLLIFNGVEEEKALITHINKHGKVISYDSILDKANAPLWAMQTFQEYGKTISEEDARLFVDINGFDVEAGGLGIDQLRIAIIKICHYVGRRKNITTDDINVNSFPSEEFVIWTVFDAMDSKDIVRCLNSVQHLIKENGISQGILKLLHLALWRYRLLLFLKESIANGTSRAEAVQDAMKLIKLQFTGTGQYVERTSEEIKPAYTEYSINKELNGNYGSGPAITKYSRKELVRIIQCIESGIIEIHQRTGDAAILLIADVLMLAVCNAMNDNLINTVRNSNE